MTPPDTPFPYLPLFRFDGRSRPDRPVDQRDAAAHRDDHPVDGACAWFAAAAGRRGDPRIYRCDAARHRHRHLFVDLRVVVAPDLAWGRSEEHTSELQSLMRTSYAVLCLTKKKQKI